MLNVFVRLEVQRRYFNIVSVEMLSKQFGMQQPSSLDALMHRQTEIDLDRLIKNGRNITLDQFLTAKKEFNSDLTMKKQLIEDRSTYVVYRGNEAIAEEEDTEKLSPQQPKKKQPAKKIIVQSNVKKSNLVSNVSAQKD